MTTIAEIETKIRGIEKEIQQAIDDDVAAVMSGQPIGNADLTNRLVQEINVLHAAIDRLRNNEQR